MNEIEEKTFKDTISTVDDSGKRVWLYPKKPKGRFYNYRQLVGYILALLMFTGPLIKIQGEPLLMFNIIERKFILFGSFFGPQDFHLFVLGMILGFVFIILFTVVYGRVWCGWSCPQTIFMELFFRRIEYWIEGDAQKQRMLNKRPWDVDKILRKAAKHFIFLLISILITNTLLSYIVGFDSLTELVTHSPAANTGLFTGWLIFTALFYWVFASFREQVCTVVCPYGRLQGVLLGKESIVVAYDHVRGEPRARVSKQRKAAKLRDLQGEDAAPKFGDCIDCDLCVKVCPTGIDIRNGTQLECVNCTACIDACDSIMDKVNKPHGLIRFASENEIEKGEKFSFNGRMIAYTAVLIILIGVIVFLLSGRSKSETLILRAQGQLYERVEETQEIRNFYTYKVVNKTNDPLPVSFKLRGMKGRLQVIGGGENLEVEAQETLDGALFVFLPESEVKGMKSEIAVEVYSGEELLEVVEFPFLGPVK